MSVEEDDIWTWTKDDLFWFLDHWIIVRSDGTPILNGTPEDFEKALRELMS